MSDYSDGVPIEDLASDWSKEVLGDRLVTGFVTFVEFVDADGNAGFTWTLSKGMTAWGAMGMMMTAKSELATMLTITCEEEDGPAAS